MTATSPAPISRPVDARTASLLALIHGDPVHAADRARVVDAIVETAGANYGLVDPNVLRLRLQDADGDSLVYPAVVGAVVAALRHRGVLKPAGWVVTTGSQSGNNGRPAMSYWLRAGAL